MKQCVITGGGSKLGRHLTENFVRLGYFVHLVTSTPVDWAAASQVNVVLVDWKNITLKDIAKFIPSQPIDVIFFNHNSSALSREKFQKGTIQNIKDWQQSYFVASQLPFYLIHSAASRIKSDTKIGWMLSELIKHPVDSQVGYADYIGNKTTNACIMKSFSQNFPASFFGINPELIEQPARLANILVNFIDRSAAPDLNGKIFYSDGQLFDF